ncbi:hypothetical protein [Kineococcus sp. SYSU DK003]|uniref:hypothetical protein n=1 Tax=Kineococcus sp. SYSU DK003 TaxID=3383124 RepID=UPI003D7D9C6A
MSHHRDEPASFLEELFPGEGPELALTPRSAAPAGTRTSAAFGGREVGPPVSRLTAPVEEPGPVPGPVARPQRCPSCGARVRAEQEWCSLCHTSLLPTPAPESAPEPAPEPVAAPAVLEAGVLVREDEDGQLALDLGAATRAGRPALDAGQVERMLGDLARTSARPVRGLGSRKAKVLVAAGGAAGLTALLLGGTAVLGAILG